MPDWGPIGQQVYERTYSRRKPDGSHEQWHETVARVVHGNCDLVPGVPNEERERLIELIESFKIMPAGRHLWVSGVPGRQYLFNCHRAGWTERLADHFTFAFEELMRGGGVGANYSEAPSYRPTHVDLHLGCRSSHDDLQETEEAAGGLTISPSTWERVADSREGWTKALEDLLLAHQSMGPPVSLYIDLSDIRPRGAKIERFGGIAAGPAPIARMLHNVNALLNSKAGGALTPIDLMDIDHAVAECVVSGNVRRSARMSIMHWEDPSIDDFLSYKSRDGVGWSTNISVEVDERFWQEASENAISHAARILADITEGMTLNGEPGIFNSELASAGETGDVRCTNPCGEIALEPWENCNLGHLNLALLENIDEAREAARLMARFLLRATCSPDVSERQQAVLHRNRRIGVGIYGFQEWAVSRGIRLSEIAKDATAALFLKSLKYQVMGAAWHYANELGIPVPIKHTTVAPTGTISLLSGHSAGIHPVFARRFIRRIRYASNDPGLAQYDPEQMEPDLCTPNTTVVAIECEDPIVSRMNGQTHLVEDASEIDVRSQMELQHWVQANWADNAVSYTASLPLDYSPVELAGDLLTVGPFLKGFTAFPEMSRAQSPLERLPDSAERLTPDQVQLDCVSGACPVK